MNKFWDLYEKNVVISGALALMLVGTCCALPFFGRPIPVLLGGFAGMACGYFFGSGKAKDAAQVIKGEGAG